MEIKNLVDVINQVCGLPVNLAKTCLYYCAATHFLNEINWMSVLDIVAPKGSGKSRLIDVLKQLCFDPYFITCHNKMTSVTLRNELVNAKDKTAVIEEGDLYPNRRELESYLINRVDKRRTSAVPVTVQVPTPTGANVWRTDKFHVFGSTILHDRHEMVDMAADRRSIVINIKHQRGKRFLKPDDTFLKSLNLPAFSYGNVPVLFEAPEIDDNAFDAWEPLIRIADSLRDDDWIEWAWYEVLKMGDRLADGQQFEMELVIFSALVQGFYERSGFGLMPDRIAQEPLPLSTITDIVRKEYEYMHPKTISTQLKKMGFKNIRKVGGVFKVHTTLDEMRSIALEIGYEEQL